MSAYIKRSIWLVITLFGWLLLVLPIQAASFDCAKAQSKVEKLICDNQEISKLDEEIASLYSEVFKKFPDEFALKSRQREWLKARNLCGDAPCLHRYYQGRIAELKEANVFKNEERYALLMSKDDELCTHMLQVFNDDLKKYGWNGDAHQEEHEEFKRIPWQPAQFSSVINGRVEYTNVEGALFDFNNDGVQDFVVRWKASLSNARADLLFMLGSEMAEKKNELTSREFGDAKNRIYLAGWFYNLAPPFGSISGVQASGIVAGVRVLEPFVYHETSYLVMRPLFEELPIEAGYAVITKYGGGKFIDRELTGKMEDVCYYQRNRAKRAH